MKKGATLFATHLCIGIAKDEADGGEEIALSGAIAANNHVMLRREGLNDSLILVAVAAISRRIWCCARESIPLKALDDDLFDMHLGAIACMRT